MNLLLDLPFRLLSPDEAGGEGEAVPATPVTPAADAGAFPENPDLGDTGNVDFDFPDNDEDFSEGPDGPNRPAETGAAKTGVVETPPASPPAAPAAPEAATTPPAPQTPAVAATPQVPPVAAQPAPVAPAAQPAPAETPATASPSEARQTLMGLIDQSRQTWQDELVKSTFALTQEEANQLDSGDLGEVIPRLQARVFIEAVRSTVAIVESALPGMVMQAMAVQTAARQGDDEFYSSRQDLIPYRQQIVELARTIRTLNPEMPKADFLQKLDLTARAMFGVGASAPAAPRAPAPGGAVPAVRSNGTMPPPVVSRAPTGAPAPTDPNDWGQINQLFDLD